MKKIILLLIAAALIAAGLVYFPKTKRVDETKTVASPEAMITLPVSADTSLTTIDEELQTTKLEDFDQEIDALDQSINQL